MRNGSHIGIITGVVAGMQIDFAIVPIQPPQRFLVDASRGDRQSKNAINRSPLDSPQGAVVMG
ncbi:MAG: hypothetical protein MH252_06630 [Thermosynechococcaceae cyanobacterium MS004]|nr:hypothetical protein [Thermosynechococcaceae cyanobacterium MS004]